MRVDCFCIGPETSGWFRKEIKSVDELKGLKMRFFGLGAQVMQKLGVSTQLLAAADIYPALERGVIDATEFSMPTMDIKLGFHQIAKFNYFPGWHQQVSCSELLMNKKACDALPDALQGDDRGRGQAQVIYTYAETEATQFDVMAEMRDKHKVQVKRWSDKDAGGLREGLARGARRKSRPRTRCSRRSPITTSTTARSTRSGATPQVMKPTYQQVSSRAGAAHVLRRPAPARDLRSA